MTHQQAVLTESRPGHLGQSGNITERKRVHTSNTAGTQGKEAASRTPEVAGPKGSQSKQTGWEQCGTNEGPAVRGEGDAHVYAHTQKARLMNLLVGLALQQRETREEVPAFGQATRAGTVEENSNRKKRQRLR